MENWYATEVTVESGAVEAVEFAFNETGAVGTEINLLGLREPQAQTVVIGYSDEIPDEDNLRSQILKCLRIFGYGHTALKKLESHRVVNRDWLAEWKKHWKATEVGKFIIAPPWENITNTDKIVIHIEPNMAFGTGTHETTQLCLQKIGNSFESGQTFLDVGTGTGILAIAVAKLSSEDIEAIKKENNDISLPSVAKIFACDTDEGSVKIARVNGALNGVGDLIEFADGPIDAGTPVFDFVCANLTIDVIVPILPLLTDKFRKTLLLSGILVPQRSIIEKELKKLQISNFKFETAGEWISVIITRDC